jgi:integrase
MALTVKSVKQARYKGGQDIRWDNDVPGFGVRINPGGSKTYVLKYRTRTGRSRLLSIGRADILPLAKARARAKRALVDVLDGVDPLAQRERERTAVTVAEFFDHYVERHSKVSKRSWQEDERRLGKVANELGRLALPDLTTADLAEFHARIGRTAKVEANRCIEVVKAALNKAKKWGYLPESALNPAVRVERFPEKSRERFLTRDEFPRVLNAVGNEKNAYIRGVFLLILLSGMRKSEALQLRWQDVDLENRLLRIRRTKTGKGRTVPLTPPAAQLLESLPREMENPWVFPGRKRGTRLSSIKESWKRIRQEASVEDVTIHDLRRSVGSHLAMQGVGLPIVGAILGHTSPDATAIYARLQPDAGREALDRYAAMLTELGGQDLWRVRGE